MKSCKTCNEFMCGQSNTDCISEYCGGKNTYIPKIQTIFSIAKTYSTFVSETP